MRALSVLMIAHILKEKGVREMPDIVLTRIDNRLIHGQGATQWSG